MVRVNCPYCRKLLNIPDHLIGAKATCPRCIGTFPVSRSGLQNTRLSQTNLDLASLKTSGIKKSLTPRPKSISKSKMTYTKSKSRQSFSLGSKFQYSEKPSTRTNHQPREDISPSRTREKERQGRRYRKKYLNRFKRRRSRSPSSDWFFWVLYGVIGISIFCLFLSFSVYEALYVPIFLGWFTNILTSVWYWIKVSEDSWVHVILSVCVPFYGIVYLLSRYEELSFPFEANALCVVLMLCAFAFGELNQKPGVKPITFKRLFSGEIVPIEIEPSDDSHPSYYLPIGKGRRR